MLATFDNCVASKPRLAGTRCLFSAKAISVVLKWRGRARLLLLLSTTCSLLHRAPLSFVVELSKRVVVELSALCKTRFVGPHLGSNSKTLSFGVQHETQGLRALTRSYVRLKEVIGGQEVQGEHSARRR